MKRFTALALLLCLLAPCALADPPEDLRQRYNDAAAVFGAAPIPSLQAVDEYNGETLYQCVTDDTVEITFGEQCRVLRVRAFTDNTDKVLRACCAALFAIGAGDMDAIYSAALHCYLFPGTPENIKTLTMSSLWTAGSSIVDGIYMFLAYRV